MELEGASPEKGKEDRWRSDGSKFGEMLTEEVRKKGSDWSEMRIRGVVSLA